MTPTNLTHDELERWHYANGNVQAAALHAIAADGEEAIDAAEEAESKEITRLQDDLDTTCGELDDAYAEIAELEEKVGELQERIEELENPLT